ncbi:2747_t:CDS:2 [Paraglomus occultum]|uniref:2747_t:CDS:1 n=1 Tax=Paraglomus occultum TaxID=144539 RepID=A0A9N8VYW1_9GLOM|nr:2747_t:CDS:2 [Paraglomus occultum]
MDTSPVSGSFLFTISDPARLSMPVYSPPFATSYNTFWQLEFHPISVDNPEYCALYLNAVANPQELVTTKKWEGRSELSAELFARLTTEQSSGPDTIMQLPMTQLNPNGNGRIELGYLSNYSLKNPSWGKRTLIERTHFNVNNVNNVSPGVNRSRYTRITLPNNTPTKVELTIGVKFQSTVLAQSSFQAPLPGKPFPKEILQVLEADLNKSDRADVQFNLQEGAVFANSSVLCKRSEYFSHMLQGNWSESIIRSQKQRKRHCPSISVDDEIPHSISSPSSKSSSDDDVIEINSNIKYIINVPDIPKEAFLDMLRYLYTDQVSIPVGDEAYKAALDLFATADKYLLNDLRQRAKAEIYQLLSPDNVVDILFGTAWKWPDLKEDLMAYIADNVRAVKESDSFKNLGDDSLAYPKSVELLKDLMVMLYEKNGE